MQDFTGVPAVVDLAAMRDAMKTLGGDPSKINPLVPVDLVIDHSVIVNFAGTPTAFKKNVAEEYAQNQERYTFLKWAQKAFENFRVVPPGTGICHQVNLEYLSQTVWLSAGKEKVKVDGKDVTAEIAYPDTLVGTDSHTTMVNGLAVLGWGVGGIEAEAAMLGQPYSMVLPEVIGFRLNGKLKEGITATDLVLTVTQMLRKRGVVGKFVEFFGPGLDHLTIEDRATIGNMAPEYGATCGFFPIDDDTIDYLTKTARKADRVALVKAYAKAQGMYRTKNTLGSGVHRRDEARARLGRALARRTEAPAGSRAAEGREERLRGAMDKEFNKGAEQGKRFPVEGAQARHRSRRRRDRGDHVVHQHVEPERDGGGGPARQESGGARAQAEAVGEDLARARVSRSSPSISTSPACRRSSTSSASISSASAARAASATPDRSPRRSPSRSPRTTSSRPRCFRAIATSKAASTRTCGRTISPRRRWSSPMRSPGT